MEGIAWRWQSLDGSMMKAPLAREVVGPNPTTGEKNGSQRHLLVDGRGVPLSIVVTGANRHEVTQTEAVLEAVMVTLANPPQRLGAGLSIWRTGEFYLKNDAISSTDPFT